jgi:UDP-N-acetylmuramoylalanine-D-glutamate ligase
MAAKELAETFRTESTHSATGGVVKFDDSGITNAYATVCNVSSSREEVVLIFGMNNAWERDASELRVKLNSRVILSPFAAKRLAALLNGVIHQYEGRFGMMDLSAGQAEKPTGK